MLHMFENLMDMLGILIDFVVTFFKNVVEMVKLVTQAFALASSVIAFMPVQYQAILIVLIAYYLIYVIIKFGG